MITKDGESFFILAAEDDEDDQILFRQVMKINGWAGKYVVVETGQQVIEYLTRAVGPATDQPVPRIPDLIMLDLNMPLDGREALKYIKSHPSLRKIPIVVFTTSREEDDRRFTLNLGVDRFVTKPASFRGWVDALSTAMAPFCPASAGCANT